MKKDVYNRHVYRQLKQAKLETWAGFQSLLDRSLKEVEHTFYGEATLQKCFPEPLCSKMS